MRRFIKLGIDWINLEHIMVVREFATDPGQPPKVLVVLDAESPRLGPLMYEGKDAEAILDLMSGKENAALIQQFRTAQKTS